MGEQGECRLLGGPAAISAQLLLASLATASLLYKRCVCCLLCLVCQGMYHGTGAQPTAKPRQHSPPLLTGCRRRRRSSRHVERPQRPLNIWGLDVSKQAVSMLAAHACGEWASPVSPLPAAPGAGRRSTPSSRSHTPPACTVRSAAALQACSSPWLPTAASPLLPPLPSAPGILWLSPLVGAAAKPAATPPPPPPACVRACPPACLPAALIYATHPSPECPADASVTAPSCADTTIGLLLTIGLHKAALRGARWFGERYGQRYGGSGALEPVSGGAANLAHERWFEAMQQCGNYGGWLLLLLLLLPLLVGAPNHACGASGGRG